MKKEGNAQQLEYKRCDGFSKAQQWSVLICIWLSAIPLPVLAYEVFCAQSSLKHALLLFNVVLVWGILLHLWHPWAHSVHCWFSTWRYVHFNGHHGLFPPNAVFADKYKPNTKCDPHELHSWVYLLTTSFFLLFASLLQSYCRSHNWIQQHLLTQGDFVALTIYMFAIMVLESMIHDRFHVPTIRSTNTPPPSFSERVLSFLSAVHFEHHYLNDKCNYGLCVSLLFDVLFNTLLLP